MLSLQVTAFLSAAVLLPAGAVLLGLGLRRRPAREALAADRPGGPLPHPVSRLVPADHRSTDPERQECRARLGPTYDTHLVVVADNLARRPAALRGLVMEPHDLPVDDLVTVSRYLHGPSTGLDQALRNGTAEPQRAVIACLASGLRRFPFHRGACYGMARATGLSLDAYLPGLTVVEPAFVRTDTTWSPDWSAGPAPDDTEIVFAFWSRTGRKVGALGAGSETVMFAAGTSFRVLGVQNRVAGAGPGVVFLDEYPQPAGSAHPVPARTGNGQRRILARLRQQMTEAQQRAVEADLRPTPELGFTPGFDETGRRYQEEPAQPAQR